MKNTQKDLKNIIQTIVKTNKSITDEKKLVEDLGFDSLSMMELVTALEDEYDVCLSIGKISRIKTVKDLFQAVENISEYSVDKR